MDSVSELRVSLTMKDFERAIRFYQDVLGLSVGADWSSCNGRCVVFAFPTATVEVIDERQASYIDSVEVGRRVAGQTRFAFQVPRLEPFLSRASSNGMRLVNGPVQTPWGDINSRLLGPDDMQITLFQSSSAG